MSRAARRAEEASRAEEARRAKEARREEDTAFFTSCCVNNQDTDTYWRGNPRISDPKFGNDERTGNLLGLMSEACEADGYIWRRVVWRPNTGAESVLPPRGEIRWVTEEWLRTHCVPWDSQNLCWNRDPCWRDGNSHLEDFWNPILP